MSDEAFALEPAPETPVEKIYDERRFMPEPPPVRVAAVADMMVSVKPVDAAMLTRIYCDLLGMVRDDDDAGRLRVWAENVAITFVPAEASPERQSVRPLGVEVPSLALLIERLLEAGVEYLRQKSVDAGDESILILDPGGNWIEVRESRIVG